MQMVFFDFSSKAQKNEQSMLTANNICLMHTYLTKLKKNGKSNDSRSLIQTQSFDTSGRLIAESFYENGDETLKRQFIYYETDEVRTLIVTQKQGTVSYQYEKGGYFEIITGGIPDYFPTFSYYPSGLIKSETTFRNGQEYLLLYEYVVR